MTQIGCPQSLYIDRKIRLMMKADFLVLKGVFVLNVGNNLKSMLQHGDGKMDKNVRLGDLAELLAKGDPKEMNELQNQVGNAVRKTLRRYRSNYGDQLSHYDPEAISLDIQQEVLAEIVQDCQDDSKREHLKKSLTHIYFVTRTRVDEIFDKVMRNKGATLTKREKAETRDIVWPGSNASDKKTVYRIGGAFLSFEECIDNGESFAANFDALDLETYEWLLKAMSGLSEDCRFVMELYYFEGLKQTDVAKAMGITERTVRTKLKQSITEIQKFLKSSEGSIIEV